MIVTKDSIFQDNRLHKPRLFTHRSLQCPLHRHPSTATSNFSLTTSLQFLIDKQKKQHCATMSSRLVPSALRACSRPAFQSQQFARNFRTSPPSLETSSAALPLRKPVGAFRGGYVPRLLISCMTASLLRVLTKPCSLYCIDCSASSSAPPSQARAPTTTSLTNTECPTNY